jgi:hypothetical protein
MTFAGNYAVFTDARTNGTGPMMARQQIQPLVRNVEDIATP